MDTICQVIRQCLKTLDEPAVCYNLLIDLVEKFAKYGLIHSDFNEFNVMIDYNKKIWVIDFPQMVSTHHKNSEFFYNRDIKCINDFFERKFGFVTTRKTELKLIERICDLDIDIKAAGHEAIKNIDVGDTKALVE